MGRIECESGYTQIARVLEHTRNQAKKAPVQALTYIGDCCEEEIDQLAGLAGELGELNCPIFVFQEGNDATARKVFRLMALRSSCAYFTFNPEKPDAVERLSEQLNAVARHAVGDADALEGIATIALTDQRH